MGRTKEFDPDAALDTAMELFWARGYEATSLADLTGALGIGRASFYATFGSKHQLYELALDRYMSRTNGETPLEILARPGPALDAVRALIRSYAAGAPADRPRGCLVVNATVECPDDDAGVGRRLDGNRAGLEAALTATLLRARTQGELGPATDPVTLARFLVVLLNGMQVLARATGDERARLDAAARVAFDALH